MKKLVKEYLDTIALRLSADYGLSFEVATRAVEDLDLLNIYKDDYDFLLHEDISTWADIAYQKYITEEFPDESGKVVRIAFEGPVKEENMKNKTTVKPLSYQLLVYHEQPTTKNTKIGDIVLYKSELWLNDGNIVAPMSLNNYINVDKDGTILDKPLIKDYVDEKVKEVSKENTMKNYIIINGKKSELTEEQLKQLGIEVEKETENKRNNPFNRSEKYCTILKGDTVAFNCVDTHSNYEDNLCKDINYFNDVNFAQQLAWHELLNRKLLKYAWDNEAEDCNKIWNGENLHYFIFLDTLSNKFKVESYFNVKILSTIYFSNKKVAKQAIQDIIEPFMKEHPEFIW